MREHVLISSWSARASNNRDFTLGIGSHFAVPVHTENTNIVYWGLKQISVTNSPIIVRPVLTGNVSCYFLVSSWHVSSPHPDNFVVCEGNCRWVDFLKEIFHIALSFFTVLLFARLEIVRSVHLQFWKAPFAIVVNIRVVHVKFLSSSVHLFSELYSCLTVCQIRFSVILLFTLLVLFSTTLSLLKAFMIEVSSYKINN